MGNMEPIKNSSDQPSIQQINSTKTEMGNDALEAFGENAFVSITPLGRVGEPADIAQSVYFLASPEGAWITGQILEASGGMAL